MGYKDFVFRAWDTFAKKGRESGKALSGALFQSLCSVDIKCLPYDLISTMDNERMKLCWSATQDKLDVLFMQAEMASNMRPPAPKKQKVDDRMAQASAAAAAIAASLPGQGIASI